MKSYPSFITFCLFKPRAISAILGRALVLLTLGLLATSWVGCSTVGTLVGDVKPVDSKADETQIPDLHLKFPYWKRLPTQGESPDAEWQSEQTFAIIYINSACRENLDGNADLKELTTSILSQWRGLNIVSEKNLTVSNYPALETTGEGHFLQRERKFQIVTLRSPHCIYDLGFLSPVDTFDDDLAAFQTFKASLNLK